jgi:hypothetical protein
MGDLMEDGQGSLGRHPACADAFTEPDGTIVIRFHAGVELTLALTAPVVAEHIRLAGGEKRPVLADVRGLVSADRASRELAASPAVVAATARMAIVVGNPVTRVLGNFFLKVTTPAYPTRIFKDEAQARAWLKEPSA